MPFHSHPCANCKTPVVCDGDTERNDDGWPEWICVLYHLPNGFTLTVLCEACADGR